MTDVRTDAELTRLAVTLGVDRDRVERFAPAGAAAIRALTEQISDRLLAGQMRAFERVAALAEKLPAGLATTLAQKVLGPALTARAAAALRPAKAAELAPRLPPEFLASVAASIDPRHVAELLGQIPPELAASVATALEARGDAVPMGLLMSQLSPAALRAGADALSDGAILRAALFVEEPERLGGVLSGFDDARVRGLARAAAAEGLEAELGDLVARVEGEQRERIERLAADR